MKIVIVGGTGLMGAKLVNNLRQQGHEVVAASPSRGINSVTGEGLVEALTGAQVAVDVTNSPSFEDKGVLEFFEASTRNLLAAEAAARVDHHVALSVVGTDRLPASGYFRAKLAQEKLIKASPIPYTIVRATQFFEFVGGIAHSATDGQAVRLPSALMQPIVSEDVAAALASIAAGSSERRVFEQGSCLEEYCRSGGSGSRRAVGGVSRRLRRLGAGRGDLPGPAAGPIKTSGAGRVVGRNGLHRGGAGHTAGSTTDRS
jgi:uncharacterized protein YbjT (DUF2867 family)